jgi:hypothetical protein
MPSELKLLRDTVLDLIGRHPGISDREIAERFNGPGSAGGTFTPLCRELAEAGLIKRRLRPDALLGNWLQKADNLGGEGGGGRDGGRGLQG